ncbi:MAG: protein translocase subunit SecD [Candidatus Moranbacteria bacterium CG_4_10_14_3_um_filter_45_9]|nr:MAG: protein-export membrane protein SecD [Candidatus Moranbacteria bacterium CG2_30_45_14]PIX90332.1 MAG: protein translocase subunit SecD [Candidatus Moranbacteria bacterium CG_4_10_14_3_um_filter_45_9]PJA85089.1 MAG: protein translocase subunit SecD [Candidatus Moranbacteria bacterium CG_4_9_14_3_um_filter_45_14]
MNQIKKTRLRFSGVILLGLIVGIISYPQVVRFIPPLFNVVEKLKVNEGLDLQGGIHLEYKADVSQLPSDKVSTALSSAEAVIERRVNAFGVGEPLVQLSRSGTEERIIVELPGIKDIEQAKKMIKETPFLEFREQVAPDAEIFKTFDTLNQSAKETAQATLDRAKKGEDFSALAKEFSQDPGSKDNGGDLDFAKKGTFVPEFDAVLFDPNFKAGDVYSTLVESQFGWHIIKKIEERGEGDTLEIHSAHILIGKRSIDQYPELQWVVTGLTGKNLKSASVDYHSQGVGSPQVALQFDSEGTQLFADITKKNIGKPVAIFLDKEIISQPTVQNEIVAGQAVITGNFTMQEANALVKRLNEGALPVPITLIGQQSVDASLGKDALEKSLFAGLVGLSVVAVFMILYYRFLGLVAVFALLLYTAMLFAIFKLSVFTPFAITVTLSGIAGFVLSIGMAVDANVLIFERMREELAYGKNVHKALEEGFHRAWPSIRDGNYSTLITTFILIASGTGFVKGFAIILTIGVLLSMFTAVVLVHIVLKFLVSDWAERYSWILVPKKKLLDHKE